MERNCLVTSQLIHCESKWFLILYDLYSIGFYVFFPLFSFKKINELKKMKIAKRNLPPKTSIHNSKGSMKK